MGDDERRGGAARLGNGRQKEEEEGLRVGGSMPYLCIVENALAVGWIGSRCDGMWWNLDLSIYIHIYIYT